MSPLLFYIISLTALCLALLLIVNRIVQYKRATDTILLAVVLVTTLITCPVRKAIKQYQGTPVQSKELYSRPYITHQCPVAEEQVVVAKAAKKQIRLLPLESNTVTTATYTFDWQQQYQINGGVDVHAPPLFLRLQRLLI